MCWVMVRLTVPRAASQRTMCRPQMQASRPSGVNAATPEPSKAWAIKFWVVSSHCRTPKCSSTVSKIRPSGETASFGLRPPQWLSEGSATTVFVPNSHRIGSPPESQTARRCPSGVKTADRHHLQEPAGTGREPTSAPRETSQTVRLSLFSSDVPAARRLPGQGPATAALCRPGPTQALLPFLSCGRSGSHRRPRRPRRPHPETAYLPEETAAPLAWPSRPIVPAAHLQQYAGRGRGRNTVPSRRPTPAGHTRRTHTERSCRSYRQRAGSECVRDRSGPEAGLRWPQRPELAESG